MNKKAKGTSKKTQENFIGESKVQSFEKTVDRLEEVVRLLERGDAPLDESMALFREGAELIGACEKMLDEAEQIVSSADIGDIPGRGGPVFDIDGDPADMLFDDDENDEEY